MMPDGKKEENDYMMLNSAEKLNLASHKQKRHLLEDPIKLSKRGENRLYIQTLFR